MRKKLLTLVLISALTLLMTACGLGSGGSEWVYVPEYLEVGGENISWYDSMLVGDHLYYSSRSWDMETGTSTTLLCSVSLTDGATQEIALDMPTEQNVYLQSWTFGEDGNLYALLEGGNWDEATGVYTNIILLGKFDDQGKQLFIQDISGIQEDEYSYFSGICVDSEGRIYLSGRSQLWVFDSEGNQAGEINCEFVTNSYTGEFFCGQDGNIYAPVTTYNEDSSSTSLYMVNFDTKNLEEKYPDFPSGNYSPVQTAEGNFLMSDGTVVTEYDPKNQKSSTLLTWLDSDINGTNVRNFGVLSDGRVVAVYEDWMSNESGVALLTRTNPADVPVRQQIVIATMSADSDMLAAAVNFNKSNDTYRVTVKEYLDGYSETAYADAMANLNNDITSRNCPDIIFLSGVDVSQLAAKGVFEDLSPYLDASSVLNREELLESVLDAYTYNGVLVSIPDSFRMTTLVGSAADLGTEPGWTLDEMMAYADAHPNADLFHSETKQSILNYCLTYNMDTFVDWNTGSCNFDSDEFKKLLEFVGRFPDEYNWEEGRPSEPTRIQNGEVLLSYTGIYDLDDLQVYMEMFKGDVVCIGFPNSDGSSGCILQGNGAYAITAKSDVKVGAWVFIESFLTRDNVRYRWGLPVNRVELETMVEDEIQPYMLDENGEIMKDGEGNPMKKDDFSWSSIGYEDGWEFRFHTLTQEEADLVLDLIDVARPASGSNQQIVNIINEEAEAFFQGQKTVDEVTPIIQSRIGLYVSENS